ncbi:helix-turn-helix domain-containing protein [Candidatus Tisiphia endosymbiont of Oplodontha viridula]|uniref:helix-turn-helix domain-containing protein n=1 Tax=Candidatus Tisiphia endosymbiont of Oplodontha viridula TaxID=3077925 RepID=UPI0035C88F3F
MSKNVLTEEQREKLKERHKTERDGRIRDRIKAVLMYDDGYSNVEIAKVLLLSHESIRKYIVDYQKANKLDSNNGGSTSKLSDGEREELASHLEANNYVYAKDIMHHIENKYGVTYTITGVTKLLYKLGFVYKKLKIVPAKLDFDKQELFKLNYSLLIYHNFEQFSEAINKFFSNIGDYKDRLRTFINDNFQTITVNHFCNSSG